MRVRINAGGRDVEGECPDTNMSIRQLFAETFTIWKCTEGARPPGDGPASYGFIAERSDQE